MHQIPERTDIEEVSKACDQLMAYMREHLIRDERSVESIATICRFVSRVKAHTEWLENLVMIYKKSEEKND